MIWYHLALYRPLTYAVVTNDNGSREIMIVRPANSRDVEVLTELSSSAFGADYLNSALLNEVIDSSEAILEVVCADRSQPVGFCLSWIVGPSKALDILGLDECPEDLMGVNSVGIIKSAVVDPQYRRQGAMTDLADSVITEMSRRGAEIVCAPLWKMEDGHTPAASPLEACGMELRHHYPHHWQEGSAAGEFECPTCGPGECRCSMVLFCAEL